MAVASSSPFAGVAFDLDGTLIDSAPDLRAALNRLLAIDGLGPLSIAQVALMIGDGVAKLVERGFEAAGKPVAGADLEGLARRFTVDYEANACVETRPFPGVREVLSKLRSEGVRLAVCTNKPEGATREILAALKLDALFGAVVGGDTVPGIRKPKPEPLAAALKALGIDPSRAAMVGDSMNDVATARALGIPVIAVSFGYTRIRPAELGADLLIDRFEQVPAALAQLGKARATVP